MADRRSERLFYPMRERLTTTTTTFYICPRKWQGVSLEIVIAFVVTKVTECPVEILFVKEEDELSALPPAPA